jgi:hypothetical protein
MSACRGAIVPGQRNDGGQVRNPLALAAGSCGYFDPGQGQIKRKPDCLIRIDKFLDVRIIGVALVNDGKASPDQRGY